MLIGYRNDAGAWQDPSGQYAYGRTEWRDLHAALVWAHDHGARDVVLGGASMGGGIVASYLEHVEDHHGVSGVVLDSPMLDLDTVVSWGARDERLPGGLPLPEPITWAAKRVAGLRYDVGWESLDYVDGPGGTDWADVPVLVLHGDADGTVPVSLSRDLARADDDVRLEEFPGAGHVESWNSDPGRYDELVTGFVSDLG
jgi:alpha-beta hydrolase superfamily lysophospholipase